LKSEEKIINLGLKHSTAVQLYRLMCTEEKDLSAEMIKLMHYLESFIMQDATIEDMEDLFDR